MATLHDREWTIIDDVKSEKVLKEKKMDNFDTMWDLQNKKY
jgi:hypothetical protein